MAVPSQNISLNKVIPWLAGITLAIVCLLFFNTPRPHLFRSGMRLDLGDVSVGETSQKPFRVFNDTSTPIVITGWIPSCHCMQANFSPGIILPGKSSDAYVQTTGTTPLGTHAAVIAVRWHFLGNDLVRTDNLIVSAKYVCPLSLSEGRLDFGAISLHCIPTKTLDVSPGNEVNKWNNLAIVPASDRLSTHIQPTPSGFRIHTQIDPRGLPLGIWKSSIKVYTLQNGTKTGEAIDIPVVARVEGSFSIKPSVLSFFELANHPLTFTLRIHSSDIPIRRLRILGNFVRESKIEIAKDGKDAVVVGCLVNPINNEIVVGKIPLQINDTPDTSVQLSFICYPS